jgi:hypothetical protein
MTTSSASTSRDRARKSMSPGASSTLVDDDAYADDAADADDDDGDDADANNDAGDDDDERPFWAHTSASRRDKWSSRALLHEGEVRVSTSTDDDWRACRLFLFNDALMFAKVTHCHGVRH